MRTPTPTDEGKRTAQVLSHPAFDRAPVENVRAPGPKRGTLNLAMARRKRGEDQARLARAARSASAKATAGLALGTITVRPDCSAKAVLAPAPAGPTEHEGHVIAAALAILQGRLRPHGAVVGGSRDVKDFLCLRLADLDREVFGVMFLSVHKAVIAFEVLFEGTLTQASVYPREIVKRALELNAAAVILTHNHPSGVTAPSQADLLLTEALKAALNTVDVRTLDHVIVGGLEALSFAEEGLM